MGAPVDEGGRLIKKNKLIYVVQLIRKYYGNIY